MIGTLYCLGPLHVHMHNLTDANAFLLECLEKQRTQLEKCGTTMVASTGPLTMATAIHKGIQQHQEMMLQNQKIGWKDLIALVRRYQSAVRVESVKCDRVKLKLLIEIAVKVIVFVSYDNESTMDIATVKDASICNLPAMTVLPGDYNNSIAWARELYLFPPSDLVTAMIAMLEFELFVNLPLFDHCSSTPACSNPWLFNSSLLRKYENEDMEILLLSALAQLAQLYRLQTRNWQSIELTHYVYYRRHALLGKFHRATLLAGLAHSLLLGVIGEHHQAVVLLQGVFADMNAVLGASHADTVTAGCLLGKILLQQRQFDEAKTLIQSTYEQQCSRLGPQHPDTLATRILWIRIHSQQPSCVGKVIDLCQEACDDCRLVVGIASPLTFEAEELLVDALINAGKLVEAVHVAELLYMKYIAVIGQKTIKTDKYARQLALLNHRVDTDSNTKESTSTELPQPQSCFQDIVDPQDIIGNQPLVSLSRVVVSSKNMPIIVDSESRSQTRSQSGDGVVLDKPYVGKLQLLSSQLPPSMSQHKDVHQHQHQHRYRYRPLHISPETTCLRDLKQLDPTMMTRKRKVTWEDSNIASINAGSSNASGIWTCFIGGAWGWHDKRSKHNA